MQKISIEKSRLKIPILIGKDVIHGFRTVMPIPLGQAASFNTDLVEQCARMAAIEASSCGIRWTFSPMVDISRDPRWGRIAESCGEDPYLASKMGCSMVRGYQTSNLTDITAILACGKHYVGYGAT
jgi:beta-glucosidase